MKLLKNNEQRLPVVVPYTGLLFRDKWKEITGRPYSDYYRWTLTEPEEHVRVYQQFLKTLPFDWFSPFRAKAREKRGDYQVLEEDNKVYLLDKSRDSKDLVHNGSIHVVPPPNKTRKVYDKDDIKREVEIVSARELISRGELEYIKLAVEKYGGDKYLVSVIPGIFAECYEYVGIENLFILLYEEPDLIKHLSDRLLEQYLERIKALSQVGVDGIFIEECLNTEDLISRDFFAEFSVPVTRKMVSETQKLGLDAILAYFGGVQDRLQEISEMHPDGLLVETTMKNFVNDLDFIARNIDQEITLFGNIDPYKVLEIGSHELLREVIADQARIGRELMQGNFVISTGSPVTSRTGLARLWEYLEVAESAGSGPS